MAGSAAVHNPDAIADCVLQKFDSLPLKFKPRTPVNGKREWSPLAGLVVAKEHIKDEIPNDTIDAVASSLTCVALATGMKCLPREKIKSARGAVLHDHHAEILAIRAFNKWILDECEQLAQAGDSEYVRWRQCSKPRHDFDEQDPTGTQQPFELLPSITIHMYVSCAPCGDASMELTMASQDDATPWTAPPPSASADDMPGRAHFDQLGIVRRKPSRPDAPSTWSKSCSDKLALRQCTGLLCGLVARLVSPSRAYLSSFILPEREVVPRAMQRAFGADGRMAPLVRAETQEAWVEGGYGFRPFQVRTTSCRFLFEKEVGVVSSNLAALWTPRTQEVLVNGVLQGRKQTDLKGASCVSRRRMWEAVVKVAALADSTTVEAELRKRCYADVKDAGNECRKRVKRDVERLTLHGWRRNDGDEDWRLENG